MATSKKRENTAAEGTLSVHEVGLHLYPYFLRERGRGDYQQAAKASKEAAKVFCVEFEEDGQE